MANRKYIRAGVSLMARHSANLLVLRINWSSWFDHLLEAIVIKIGRSVGFPPCENQLPYC